MLSATSNSKLSLRMTITRDKIMKLFFVRRNHLSLNKLRPLVELGIEVLTRKTYYLLDIAQCLQMINSQQPLYWRPPKKQREPQRKLRSEKLGKARRLNSKLTKIRIYARNSQFSRSLKNLKQSKRASLSQHHLCWQEELLLSSILNLTTRMLKRYPPNHRTFTASTKFNSNEGKEQL